jgi:hypothetical protein
MSSISPDTLIDRLVKSSTHPALLLLGKDTYLRDALRERVIEAAVEPATRAWW